MVVQEAAQQEAEVVGQLVMPAVATSAVMHRVAHLGQVVPGPVLIQEAEAKALICLLAQKTVINMEEAEEVLPIFFQQEVEHRD
jgi:hypothetical protein